MPVATFDTLKFALALKAAGVPEKQAEAEATVLAEALQVNLKELATKEDLAATRAELKQDGDTFRKELKRDLEDFRKEWKQDLRELEQRTNARFDVMEAQSNALRAELKGDMLLLKWMLGVLITIVAGMFIRSFFMRGPI